LSTSLVTWEAAEPLGKIEGTDWVSLGDADALRRAIIPGEHVPEEMAAVFAGERALHLALFRYPEGYEAVEVVDSATGDTVWGNENMQRFAGYTITDRGNVGSIMPTSPLRWGKIAIGNGLEIWSLDSSETLGTTTSIRPTPTGDQADPSAIDRERTRVEITPKAREIYLTASTTPDVITDIGMSVIIKQQYGRTEGELCVSTLSHENPGYLTLLLNETGSVVAMRATQGKLFDALGLQIDKCDTGMITDATVQQRIYDALAATYGPNLNNGIVLRESAMGIYRAMGTPGYDIGSVLVYRK
jgi:hypothetical protein